MTYTKKTWVIGNAMAVLDLQHLETQYTEILDELAAHVPIGHPSVYRPRADMDSYFWHSGNDGSGSGLEADTLGGSHASEIMGGVPSGLMFWWYPGNGPVPDGFYFCDGNNGTYDMRSRFPVGASGTLAVGSTVGNASITPEGNIRVGGCTLTPSNIFHTHSIIDYYSASHDQDIGAAYLHAGTTNTPTVITASVGGGSPHTHPGTFVGDATALDPVFRYLVIIQKS